MKMKRMTCAMAAAVAMIGAVPLLVVAVPANGENFKMAQVDVQVGRDRDYDRDRGDRDRYGRDRDRDVTVGIGPRRCRTITTTVRRSDGRMITRRERRCD